MKKYKCYNGEVVYVSERLTYMPTAQAGVVFDALGGKCLISYTTKVIEIDPMGWLVCHGTFSPTTRKHISAFLKEYAPKINYRICKDAYENNYTVNIYTREIVSL